MKVDTALNASPGDTLFGDRKIFRDRVDTALKKAATKIASAEPKRMRKTVSWCVETAPLVIAKTHKSGKLAADTMLGVDHAVAAGIARVVEYEPDADLRDSERVPSLENGSIEIFIRREVLP